MDSVSIVNHLCGRHDTANRLFSTGLPCSTLEYDGKRMSSIPYEHYPALCLRAIILLRFLVEPSLQNRCVVALLGCVRGRFGSCEPRGQDACNEQVAKHATLVFGTTPELSQLLVFVWETRQINNNNNKITWWLSKGFLVNYSKYGNDLFLYYMAFGRLWQHAKYSDGVWQSFAHNPLIEKCEQLSNVRIWTHRVEHIVFVQPERRLE
jgi:hypothetical protein